MLFIHGGGFVTNAGHSHRKMAGHLAKAAGVRGLVIEYRRAPEHPYPAQLEDAVVAYRWLLDQGIDPGHIFTAATPPAATWPRPCRSSCATRACRCPRAIVAISPWYDMEAKGETLKTNAETDTLVRPGLGEGMAAMFLGETGSQTDPLANPLHADMTGMPPIFLTAGSWEALQDNADRMAAASRSGRSRHHPGDRRTACSTSSRSRPACAPRPTRPSPPSAAGCAPSSAWADVGTRDHSGSGARVREHRPRCERTLTRSAPGTGLTVSIPFTARRSFDGFIRARFTVDPPTSSMPGVSGATLGSHGCHRQWRQWGW